MSKDPGYTVDFSLERWNHIPYDEWKEDVKAYVHAWAKTAGCRVVGEPQIIEDVAKIARLPFVYDMKMPYTVIAEAERIE